MNLHIVTLGEDGQRKCSCKASYRYGMPYLMILSITKDIDPLIFYPPWYKSYNSDLNCSIYPKIHFILHILLSKSWCNLDGISVRNLVNVSSFNIHNSNFNLTVDKIASMLKLEEMCKQKRLLLMISIYLSVGSKMYYLKHHLWDIHPIMN